MGTFSDAWRAVTGKVSSNWFTRQLNKSIWGKDITYDYTRNDYDLYRSLYFGVSVHGKAKNMQIGAMFAKPIVNSTAGFTIGNGYTISLGEGFEDQEQAINDWLMKHKSDMIESYTHSVRDGDAYLYIDEFGNLDEFDAKDVTVMLDPMTGEVVGYDVEEAYEEVDPTTGTSEKYVIIRQYRTDSTRYIRFKEGEKREEGKVIYNVVYTVDGPVHPTENQTFLPDVLISRPLPVIHIANNREPRMVYGNSELLNCLVGITNYTAVAANATKGVIYNSSPVPYISGVANPEKIAKQSNKGEDEDTDKTNWGPDTVLYFADAEAKAGFLQANGMMEDVGKLLEYYFYLIVQASETPEFIFGTAIQGSRASVETQMPIVTQKAERKRAQLEPSIRQMIEVLIDRRVRMSDTVFLPLKNAEYDIVVEFPDIVDEDKTITITAVTTLLDAGALSEATAVRLLLGDKVQDIDEELKQAHIEAETKAAEAQATFEQQKRISDELTTKEE